MNEVLSIAIPGGTPGEINALTNTPASNNFLQNINTRSSSPRTTGTIAVLLSMTLNPRFLNPSLIFCALRIRLVILSGSAIRISSAASAAATEAGVGDAENISAGELCFK